MCKSYILPVVDLVILASTLAVVVFVETIFVSAFESKLSSKLSSTEPT